MLTNISNYFHSRVKPLNILIAVGTQLIFGFLILPKMQTIIDPKGGTPVLDLRFGYSSQKAYEVLDIFGQNGREAYFFTEAFLDVLYPIVYSIAFTLILSLFFQKSYSKNHYFQKFNIFPLFVGIADLFENTGILILIANFPNQIIWAAHFASWAGLVKWGATLFNLILLLIGIISWGLLTLVKTKR